MKPTPKQIEADAGSYYSSLNQKHTEARDGKQLLGHLAHIKRQNCSLHSFIGLALWQEIFDMAK